jgi:hypothetical protein
MAGNLPGYEEALRAMYAKRADGFEEATSGWPEDVRAHAAALVRAAMAEG